MSPDSAHSVLDFTPMPGEEPAIVRILDLTGVPYIDSMGMGLIVTEYVRCRNRGIQLIAAGLTPRVREIFGLTKVDTVIPTAATVDDAVAQ